VYWTLGFTAVFFVALFGFTLWTEADHVTARSSRSRSTGRKAESRAELMACPSASAGRPVIRESLNAGIGVLLGVTGVRARLLRALLRALAAGPPLASSRGICRGPPFEPTDALMQEWLGMPVPAAAHAGDVDRIMVLVHWLMLVLFVGWAPSSCSCSSASAAAAIRSRATTAPRRAGPRGSKAACSPRRWSLLAFFSIPVWSARVDALPAARESTVVRVVAEQFAWNVHYPGADGVFGRTDIRWSARTTRSGSIGDPAGQDDITTINRLNLPIGKPVLVYLSSKDVVHSFGLPQMRVKQDATPGIVQPVWFTPIETGEWDIVCSQLCGLGTTGCAAFYAIQTQAEFDAWKHTKGTKRTNSEGMTTLVSSSSTSCGRRFRSSQSSSCCESIADLAWERKLCVIGSRRCRVAHVSGPREFRLRRAWPRSNSVVSGRKVDRASVSQFRVLRDLRVRALRALRGSPAGTCSQRGCVTRPRANRPSVHDLRYERGWNEKSSVAAEVPSTVTVCVAVPSCSCQASTV
jgi:cytochrome c oxidase subunit II